jgi:7,8-dihydropterin-6-yl-methyl-4-(beta-D-ribofuranosyl)aminobenzene 5'-phosphate synthase
MTKSENIYNLRQCDSVEIVSLVDNISDLITLSGDEFMRYSPVKGQEMGTHLLAEHGFSVVVKVTRGDENHTIVMDGGLKAVLPDGSVHTTASFNLRAMSMSLDDIEGIFISHGHFDHTGGIADIIRYCGKKNLPVWIHPDVLSQRWLCFADKKIKIPALVQQEIEEAGGLIVKSTQPEFLVQGLILTSGEIERKTDFEKGYPCNFKETDGELKPDPEIVDDQCLIMNLKNKGLVIITGCAHAGVINSVLHARKITGVKQIYAIMGGFHLEGAFFRPLIKRTVEELQKLKPHRVIPGHCTGYSAMNELQRVMPEAYIHNVVGTRYTFKK